MKRIVKTLIAVMAATFAVVALAACSSGQASSAAPSAASAGGASSASTASSQKAVPGQEGDVTVSLGYNAGTGFEWSWAADVDGLVELASAETVDASETDEPIDGGPLVDRFTFRALAPGEVVLTFDLTRSWEDGDPADEQVYAFTITDDLQLVLNPYKSHFENAPEWSAA